MLDNILSSIEIFFINHKHIINEANHNATWKNNYLKTKHETHLKEHVFKNKMTPNLNVIIKIEETISHYKQRIEKSLTLYVYISYTYEKNFFTRMSTPRKRQEEEFQIKLCVFKNKIHKNVHINDIIKSFIHFFSFSKEYLDLKEIIEQIALLNPSNNTQNIIYHSKDNTYRKTNQEIILNHTNKNVKALETILPFFTTPIGLINIEFINLKTALSLINNISKKDNSIFQNHLNYTIMLKEEKFSFEQKIEMQKNILQKINHIQNIQKNLTQS